VAFALVQVGDLLGVDIGPRGRDRTEAGVGRSIERWWSAQGRSSLKRRKKEICRITSVCWQATIILVYTCR